MEGRGGFIAQTDERFDARGDARHRESENRRFPGVIVVDVEPGLRRSLRVSVKPGMLCLIAYWLLCISGCLKEETAVTQNPPPPLPVECAADTVYRTGQATYYDYADGGGNCLFDATPADLMVGAMNTVDYAGSEICGTCLQVIGPLDTIRIRIVDRCPGCGVGDIDLSPLAFSFIADTSLGRVAIKWRRVECGVSGPIVYHFKDGSNQWCTAVQIRNHRYPVAGVEYLTAQG